jgi:hypothetical protein
MRAPARISQFAAKCNKYLYLQGYNFVMHQHLPHDKTMLYCPHGNGKQANASKYVTINPNHNRPKRARKLHHENEHY